MNDADRAPIARPIVWCRRTLDDVPSGDGWLTPAEREIQTRYTVPVRRADWRLGRWTAKTAMRAAFGVGEHEVAVIAADDGAPEVHLDGGPLPVSLSISHRQGVAVAAVACAGVAVGIDLEIVEPRSDAFVREWFLGVDQVRIRAADDPHEMACLRWSIKEAAAKLLRGGLRLNVRTMEVRLAIEAGPGMWRPWQVRSDELDAPVDGWSLVDDGWVTALAVSPRLAVAPPPAARADATEVPVSAGSAGRSRWSDRPSAPAG